MADNQPDTFADPVVHGVVVQTQTQCAHWHSDRDIIAIRHKCCGNFYACISCHEALAGHPPATWRKTERDAVPVVLCGHCRRQLTIAEYLASGNACPGCSAAFNPGCARHYDLYFEM
ncbi:helper of tim [Sporothrix eucalyptigena]|uniref:Helper of tim n=1 Tax=Sporothrix eucalyptigena TaxID=1812306 RepID=A0ABP0CLH5_9PEZI